LAGVRAVRYEEGKSNVRADRYNIFVTVLCQNVNKDSAETESLSSPLRCSPAPLRRSATSLRRGQQMGIARESVNSLSGDWAGSKI
jgi:hypothetical protein